jgi:hypothetical protein
MNIIDILNFQPFGDHGVMSPLSIRMFHIIMIPVVVYMIKLVIRDIREGKEKRRPKVRTYDTRKDMFRGRKSHDSEI